ncbi:MAG: hypothetical protein DRQ55_09750 [Planctomycetota bacterium]|nr:MAG: hypothetical protein DRQ55_09750 [Planctomycetota bacterium]
MNAKTLTTADLAAELARRQKGAAKLQARRSKLLAQLNGIEKELASLGMLDGKRGKPKASTTRSPGKRPKNEMTLGDAIANAADVGAVLTPAEAVDLVLANGYKSTSKSFRVAVSTKLAQDKRFKRVGRGQYERVG